MNKLLAGLLLALSLSGGAFAAVVTGEADPALSGATLVDFETSVSGTYASNSFSGLTITASGASSLFSVDGDYAGAYNTRGRLHITNHGTEFEGLRFDTAGGFGAIAFLFGASDSSWQLNIYNSSNVLIDTLLVPATFTSNAGDYFGLSGLVGASYATLTENYDGYYSGGGTDYVFVDNIRFIGGDGNVPEPATLALLVAAGLSAASLRRKA